MLNVVCPRSPGVVSAACACDSAAYAAAACSCRYVVAAAVVRSGACCSAARRGGARDAVPAVRRLLSSLQREKRDSNRWCASFRQ